MSAVFLQLIFIKIMKKIFKNVRHLCKYHKKNRVNFYFLIFLFCIWMCGIESYLIIFYLNFFFPFVKINIMLLSAFDNKLILIAWYINWFSHLHAVREIKIFFFNQFSFSNLNFQIGYSLINSCVSISSHRFVYSNQFVVTKSFIWYNNKFNITQVRWYFEVN